MKSVEVSAEVYQQLLDYARWVHNTPADFEFTDPQLDQIQDFYCERLEDLLPDDLEVFDVETGSGCGLIVIASDGEKELRIRMRRKK